MPDHDKELNDILGGMQGYIDDDAIQAKVKSRAKAKLSALLRRVEVEARLAEVQGFIGALQDVTEDSAEIDTAPLFGYGSGRQRELEAEL